MDKAKTKISIIQVIWVCSFILAPVQPLSSQTEPRRTREHTPSQESRLEKKKKRETWEQLVSLPGTILTIPFWLVDRALLPVANFFEQTRIIARTADVLTADDGTRGLFPTYESKQGGGLCFYRKNVFSEGSNLNITAAAGLLKRQFYQISMENLRFWGPANGGFSMRYQFMPEEPFFGVGNDSQEKNRMNYAHEYLSAELSLGLDMSSTTLLTATAAADHNKILEGRDKTYPSIPISCENERSDLEKSADRIQFTHLQLSLVHDSRNQIGNPTAGWRAVLSAGLHYQFNDSEYGFMHTSADISRYIHLFYGRALVLRGAVYATEPLENRTIPFYHLSELGRRETIRGFARGRFRDKDMALATIEYRSPIIKRPREAREMASVDLFLFADAGRVSADIFDDYSRDMHIGYGGGIRVYDSRSSILQAFLGFSKEGYRFYFVLN